MGLIFRAAATAFAALALSSLSAPAVAAPSSFQLCADFSIYPDDLKFPHQFKLSGFDFEEPATVASQWFVNASGNGQGLQFSPAGAMVKLPAAVSRIDLNIGTFAGSLDVKALNAAGKVVASQTIPRTNAYKSYTLSGKGIASLSFSGGGFEASIQSICIKAKV